MTRRQGRTAVLEAVNAAAEVAAAWNDAGPVPAYHRIAQERLRREWPVLAAAVEKLAELLPSANPGATMYAKRTTPERST